ncbi:Uncharacterised protein [Candidatus Tiddalikarchaeum anstoanum]|nr:Uncharacterised protein [Candidatus Tiddalikarchaeum anstoanum]
MNTVLMTISTLLGISIGMLTMSILFAVSLGAMNVTIYVVLGFIIGCVSGFSVYWLLNNVK